LKSETSETTLPGLLGSHPYEFGEQEKGNAAFKNGNFMEVGGG